MFHECGLWRALRTAMKMKSFSLKMGQVKNKIRENVFEVEKKSFSLKMRKVQTRYSNSSLEEMIYL